MSSLSIEHRDGVATLTLRRPAKRNALDDATVLSFVEFFRKPGAGVRAVVLDAEGDHFSAGLDLGELTERCTEDALEHSLMWHRVFDTIEGGRVPVVAALKGAVIGGGLELAACAYIRVAEPSTFYALPEDGLPACPCSTGRWRPGHDQHPAVALCCLGHRLGQDLVMGAADVGGQGPLPPGA